MSSVFIFCLLIILPPCFSYVEVGRPDRPREIRPRVQAPRGVAPREFDFGLPQIDLTTSSAHSMITAIVPSPLLGNRAYGAIYGIQYHDAYHGVFGGVKEKKGVFARGIFATYNYPIPTCTPCGTGATSTLQNNTSYSPSPSTSCTTSFYEGVFRSNVGSTTNAAISGIQCLGSGYNGVFNTTSTTTTGIPCCVTFYFFSSSS